jgi:hypothetical protein
MAALSCSRRSDFSGKESDAPADLHKLFLWLAAVWVVEAVVSAERVAEWAEQEVVVLVGRVLVSVGRVADWVGQGDLWEARVY